MVIWLYIANKFSMIDAKIVSPLLSRTHLKKPKTKREIFEKEIVWKGIKSNGDI